jgi:murein DD-endopeptidase MepM/ murein hydrolase activator NlpD
MRKLAFGTVVTVTAVLTAVLTSLFWIAAYSIALPSDDASAPATAAKGASGPPAPVDLRPEAARPDPIVAPSGLVVPVAGIRPDQLVDTYTQSRAGGRPHNAIDIMAPAGTAVVSVGEGTVEKLYFSEGGGGITAYVRSPDRNWIFYYAHLQAYAPGLREGQRRQRQSRRPASPLRHSSNGVRRTLARGQPRQSLFPARGSPAPLRSPAIRAPN